MFKTGRGATWFKRARRWCWASLSRSAAERSQKQGKKWTAALRHSVVSAPAAADELSSAWRLPPMPNVNKEVAVRTPLRVQRSWPPAFGRDGRIHASTLDVPRSLLPVCRAAAPSAHAYIHTFLPCLARQSHRASLQHARTRCSMARRRDGSHTETLKLLPQLASPVRDLLVLGSLLQKGTLGSRK